MSRRSAESLSRSQDKKYSDLWSPDSVRTDANRQVRASHILDHLKIAKDPSKLHFQTYHGEVQMQFPRPEVVCDVGSGIGGVTLAYRRLQPEAQIVALDVDPRAQEEAKRSGATVFLEADVTQLTERDWHRIAQQVNSEVIDHIVALQAKGELALHLLEHWRELALSQVLFLSLIQQSDREATEKLNRDVESLDPLFARRVYLNNTRSYSEVGWIFLQSPK